MQSHHFLRSFTFPLSTRHGYSFSGLHILRSPKGRLTHGLTFKPSPLPPTPAIEIDHDMLQKLVEANKKIALLEGLSSRIPNTNLFVFMYVRKEALMSSQIEGTQCTLDDILNPLIDVNANQDVSDVVNYIKATEFAINRLNHY